VGGGRAALRNPGNRDLAVDAVAWIVGREDLMVGSSAGREVARLPRLAPAALVAVGTLEAFAVPAVIALLGGAIVAVRRTRT
jgi:hypothetical protein